MTYLEFIFLPISILERPHIYPNVRKDWSCIFSVEINQIKPITSVQLVRVRKTKENMIHVQHVTLSFGQI